MPPSLSQLSSQPAASSAAPERSPAVVEDDEAVLSSSRDTAQMSTGVDNVERSIPHSIARQSSRRSALSTRRLVSGDSRDITPAQSTSRASAIGSPARLKAEFEHSLMSCLLFNVLYMYYCDARLLVLFIRASQIVRLLYFAHETQSAQRSSSLLLFLSNIPVLLIHFAILAEKRVGESLMINFIGPEPNALIKLFYVDCVTILLQAMLASSASGDEFIVSSLPVAAVNEPDSTEDPGEQVSEPTAAALHSVSPNASEATADPQTDGPQSDTPQSDAPRERSDISRSTENEDDVDISGAVAGDDRAPLLRP